MTDTRKIAEKVFDSLVRGNKDEAFKALKENYDERVIIVVKPQTRPYLSYDPELRDPDPPAWEPKDEEFLGDHDWRTFYDVTTVDQTKALLAWIERRPIDSTEIKVMNLARKRLAELEPNDEGLQEARRKHGLHEAPLSDEMESTKRGGNMRGLNEIRKPVVTLRDLNGLILESVVIRKGTTEIEIPQGQVSVGEGGEITITDLETAPPNEAGTYDGELAVLDDEEGFGDEGEISDEEFTDFEDQDFDEFGEEGGQVNLGGEEGEGEEPSAEGTEEVVEEVPTEEPPSEEPKEEKGEEASTEEKAKEKEKEEAPAEEAKESVDSGFTTGNIATVEKPMGPVKTARSPEILIDNLMSSGARVEMVTRLRRFIESMAAHISSQEYRDLATDLSRYRAVAEGFTSILSNNTSPSELVVNTMIDADHLLDSWSAT